MSQFAVVPVDGPAMDGPLADGALADHPAPDATSADGTSADATSADGSPTDATTTDALATDASRAGALAMLFARTLGRAAVGDNEDFFDLGGDSILATALMLEIEAAIGRPLSVTMLYDAPTPAEMARLLATEDRPAEERRPEDGAAAGFSPAPGAGSRPAPGASSRIVLLRPGAAPALFMPHGLLGIVTDLYDFAQRLDTQQAIYGIQATSSVATGGAAAMSPPDRIEAMARLYVDEMRRVQPNGPYLLAGYCFGGLIALEMAQTLRRRGEQVALLALLDTHPHSRYWPWRYRAASWLRLARAQIAGPTLRNMTRHLATRVRDLPPGDRMPYLATRIADGLGVPFSLFRLSVMLHRFELADGTPMRPRTAHPAAVHRMTEINQQAFEAYKPARYDGEVVLLQTLARKRVQFDGRAVWAGLMSRLRIGTVSAHDWETVGRLVAYFATPFSQCLRAALTRTPARQQETEPV